jgi:uncharacterized damage-inducible protein DinB
MSDTPAALAEKLKAEGHKISAFFSALSPDQWAKVVYDEQAVWSARSILAHLVSAERGFLEIFTAIRDGGPGASDDFDIDLFNASQQAKLADAGPADLLENYQAARAAMVAFVASLTVDDLQKRGRHPALGVTSLAEMLKMVHLHNSLHLRDLKKALA